MNLCDIMKLDNLWNNTAGFYNIAFKKYDSKDSFVFVFQHNGCMMCVKRLT